MRDRPERVGSVAGPLGSDEVRARAEGAARPGQHHHPVVGAVLDLVEDRP